MAFKFHPSSFSAYSLLLYQYCIAHTGHYFILLFFSFIFLLLSLIFKPLLGKQMKDSPIYNIKLPPQPYKFLEGVGFVSDNEELGRSGFEPLIKELNGNTKKTDNILRIPTSFVLNGKPFGVNTELTSETEQNSEQDTPTVISDRDKTDGKKTVTTESTAADAIHENSVSLQITSDSSESIEYHPSTPPKVPETILQSSIDSSGTIEPPEATISLPTIT